jgi:hypothetical protein
MGWKLLAFVVVLLVLLRFWPMLWSELSTAWAGGYKGRFVVSLGFFAVVVAATLVTISLAFREGLVVAGLDG